MEKSSILNNQVPEGLPCGQFVYCAEGNQNILYADNNVVRLYGCETFEEFIDYIGNSFRGMVHPDDLKEAESILQVFTHITIEEVEEKWHPHKVLGPASLIWFLMRNLKKANI